MPAAAALFALLLFFLASGSGAARSPPPPPPITCSDELVSMSECFSHIVPPTDEAAPAPSPSCCETIFSALDGAGGGAACLCHLVRDPSLLGFPVNASRLASLFSTCGGSAPSTAGAFLKLCQEAKTLPGLHTDRAEAPEGAGEGEPNVNRRRRPPPPPRRRPPPPPSRHVRSPPPPSPPDGNGSSAHGPCFSAARRPSAAAALILLPAALALV